MNSLRMSAHGKTKQSPDYHVHLRRGVLLQREASREFYRALTCAKKAAAGGRAEMAVEWCRYGATVAWRSNPGFFYCHEMEQLLSQIGRNYGKRVTNPSPATGAPNRFLHVMTTAYERGGHTRAVSRWIETCAQHAPSEHHSILISKQWDTPLPTWLTRSAQRNGGELFQLPPMPSWLQTAAEIRAKSFEFDVIVLHTHPNDPLANLAFYDQPRPVIFFNHADHAFTLGMDVARVIANIRPTGHDLSSRLRAEPPRKVLLPIPLLDDRSFLWDKADARRKLGLPVDAPIALTIGEPFKFRPALGYSFPAAMQSICNADPRVLVIAVGISESEQWGELKRSTGGRFRPVGVVVDPGILELYYSAADVYLDCFPCGSLTSVLDAARHALPVQRLNNSYLPLLWLDDLALDSVVTGAPNQSDYVAGVLQWLQWPESKRSELGGRLRAAVLQEHCGASWKTKWLDSAVNALSAPCEDPVQSRRERLKAEQDRYLGLAGLEWVDQPVSMFVAVAVLGMDEVHRRIRISGVLRSVKPLLFDTVHDGMARERFLIFKELMKTILPTTLVSVMGKMLRPILKRL